MLLGKQRCRHEDRHLPTVLHSNEGRAHGDFGFAKPDITANESIHWSIGLHVGNDGCDGVGLIWRFIEGELLGKTVVFRIGCRIGDARAGSAARIDIQQFGGDIARFLRSAAARLLPLIRAEPM